MDLVDQKNTMNLTKIRFAHLADCHIGSWRDPLMSVLSIQSFEKAIDLCTEKNIDFIIIAGDLFNTSLPGIDQLKRTTKKLKQLKDVNIPVYIIAGSHDFSPSGKTMIDVLENAGLVINVAKGRTVQSINSTGNNPQANYSEINNSQANAQQANDSEKNNVKELLQLIITKDKKTGANITGIFGKAGSLDRTYYESIDRESLELETKLGYNIFLFHTLLTELKPQSLEKVDSQPLSLLPKHFDYYAGGHPHFVFSKDFSADGYGTISYPGPLFPNNFKELEDLSHGGFFIVEYKNQKTTTEFIPVFIHDVEKLTPKCDHSIPEKIETELNELIDKKDFTGKIVTIRLEGTLESGKPSDINFKLLFERIRQKGAYAILKNSSALTSKEFADVRIDISSTEEIESKLIAEQIVKEGLADLKLPDAQIFAKTLISALDSQKQEGEKVYEFEKRLKDELDRIVG